MDTYLKFVERYALAVLAILFGVTGYFVVQLGQLTADSNPYLLSEDHPARRGILELQKEFTGTYDAVLIALYNPDGVFNPTTLSAVYELSRRAKNIKLVDEAVDTPRLREIAQRYPALGDQLHAILDGGLEQNDWFAARQLEAMDLTALAHADRSYLRYLPSRLNPIAEMAGMASTENVFLDENGMLVVRKSLHDAQSANHPAAVQREVLGNGIMRNGVVSLDKKVALITVELRIKQDDADGQLRAYETFDRLVQEYRTQHPELRDKIYIAGVPIFMAEQKALMDRDMGTLLPLVLLIVTVTLVLFFRRPLGVILPLVNVVMCSVWTLGLMAMLQVPLDLITSVLPVFLITICSADALHIMSDYYSHRRAGEGARSAAAATMRALWAPVVLTTVTTVIGFLVGTSSAISSTQTFGLFMAVGLVVAQIVSLLLIPAWLFRFGGKVASERERKSRDLLGPLMERLVGAVADHRPVFAIGFASMVVVAAALAAAVNIEDAGAEYFRPDNRFRLADEFVNNHVAGTSPGWIAITAPPGKGMVSLEAVQFIDALDEFLLAQPHVTYSYSLAKYVRHIFMIMNGGDAAFDRLPMARDRIRAPEAQSGEPRTFEVDGEALVRQSVLMYENGGGTDLQNVLNSQFSRSVTLFTMNSTRATDYEALLTSLRNWLGAHTPAGYQVEVAGTPVIWTGVLEELLKGQVLSFVLGWGAVALVLMAWLRSMREGILTALPLGLTVVFYYALMAVLGIDLNIGTAIIAFMVIGIVDYSVHFLLRTKDCLNTGDTVDAALRKAARLSGRSIVLNVAVFSLGFLALLFSEFTPIVHLGMLVAAALAISGIMAILVLTLLAPAMLAPRGVPVPVPG